MTPTRMDSKSPRSIKILKIMNRFGSKDVSPWQMTCKIKFTVPRTRVRSDDHRDRKMSLVIKIHAPYIF